MPTRASQYATGPRPLEIPIRETARRASTEKLLAEAIAWILARILLLKDSKEGIAIASATMIARNLTPTIYVCLKTARTELRPCLEPLGRLVANATILASV